MKRVRILITLLLLALTLAACQKTESSGTDNAGDPETGTAGKTEDRAVDSAGNSGGPEAGTVSSTDRDTRSVRILATSDLHGKFMPWDYTKNVENNDGSAAQLAAAIDACRTDQTLLLDAGDLIQGNLSELFVKREGVHPMVRALNRMNYDVWVTGNHDYNYGMDVLRKTMEDMDAAVLTGNVYDESGAPIAAGYKIFKKNGVRVAVIGITISEAAISCQKVWFFLKMICLKSLSRMCGVTSEESGK